MKITEEHDIERSFARAIEAAKSANASDLGVFFGSLSVNISTRITQLKNGTATSVDIESELAKLKNAAQCLNAKINTSSASEMAEEIEAAYQAYVTYQ